MFDLVKIRYYSIRKKINTPKITPNPLIKHIETACTPKHAVFILPSEVEKMSIEERIKGTEAHKKLQKIIDKDRERKQYEALMTERSEIDTRKCQGRY